MLIVATLHRTDPRATVDPLTGRVGTEGYAGTASHADRCALEHALRLAEVFGARCLAVTAGPPEAEEVLREALACGADQALRIEAPGTPDPAGTAHLLHAGLAAHGARPDLVICGDRSADGATGTTPALLAGLLGAAQALGLIELAEDNGTTGPAALRAVRRLDGGRAEVLAVPLPAVCSVEAGQVRLRRASLAGTLAARTAAIPVVSVAAAPASRVRTGPVRAYRPRPRALPAPAGDTPRARLLALTGAHTPPRTSPRVLTPASPAEAADLLLAELRGLSRDAG
ncbi:mycofactocin-associated electron transfer flavoprotein beta subunit (plasmid) [Streptomyces yangpuensis]|uniref:Electron transfer flavoprotein small subunit n=1 Tax=Streptomyces yangpuensis TaxID=1648182 RepID=A0ABY5Q7Q9_9ACTN|nr:mycofactocin-associated electron transfer flavoprotein beta subunit [Streptomyces yangpuensis]UUY52482.1 mycofactocin-associated electron transfer flavoprotein beta subunit [Streptomyces yangpuensis]